MSAREFGKETRHLAFAIVCFFGALAVAIFLDAFERLAAFIAAHQFLEWEETFIAFAILGIVASAFLLLAFVKSRMGSSRDRFVKSLTQQIAKRRGKRAAVFIVDMEKSDDDALTDVAEGQLKSIFGNPTLKVFFVS